MDNIRDCINYLKDPGLVARFQKYFGVVRYEVSDNGAMLPSLENSEFKTSNQAVNKYHFPGHSRVYIPN